MVNDRKYVRLWFRYSKRQLISTDGPGITPSVHQVTEITLTKHYLINFLY